jgi:hypothetical protein
MDVPFTRPSCPRAAWLAAHSSTSGQGTQLRSQERVQSNHLAVTGKSMLGCANLPSVYGIACYQRVAVHPLFSMATQH